MLNTTRYSRRINIIGFSLIELMIVVVIISILAAIAYPSYQRYARQTRRSDAQIALTRIAAAQEKYLADFGYYAANLAGTRSSGAGAADTNSILGTLATSPNGDYTLAIAVGNIAGNCLGGAALFTCGFIATATPTGRQVGDGAFRLDATGARQWDKNNNGAYAATENTWK